MRRVTVIAGGTMVLVLAAGLGWLQLRREWAWAHGGDGVAASAEVAGADAGSFDRVVAGFGVTEPVTRAVVAERTFMVRVRWAGAPGDGSFAVVALDGRVTPPRVLQPDGGWNPVEGATGSGWDGRYADLSRHYDWLAGIADGDAGAVSVPGSESGTVVAWFHQTGENPNPRIAVTLVRTDDDGNPRWAKRLT
jgi:hypothetical protein